MTQNQFGIPTLKNLTTSKEWLDLKKHFEVIKNLHLKDLFKQEPKRSDLFSTNALDIFFDYSKNRINQQTLNLLITLAKASGLQDYKQAFFSGEKINWTEQRSVLHTALRHPLDRDPLFVHQKEILNKIFKVRNKMRDFSNRVRNGTWKGATGKKIEAVVNIGIGGSDLGPKMVYQALKYYASGPKVYYVSNLDYADLYETLKQLNPETTLFLIASKTFTTQETIQNALSAKKWLMEKLSKEAIPFHFCAISTHLKKTKEFGINEENVFEFWEFVGGRYSVWSSIGLSIACAIGYDEFENFLQGAYEMDQHFLNTPLENNIPVLLALLGIWYNNFFETSTYAVLPYSHYLELLPKYLQQLDMESNGKNIDLEGKCISYQTTSILWGEAGTNGQHSFYQLFHQGTKLIPIDLISFKKMPHPNQAHDQKFLANFIAQSQALAFGLNKQDALKKLKESKVDEATINRSLPYRVLEGNKPSNLILLETLTPNSLGKLLAMYEHKIFTQGIIWRINSFDQFGVELGKSLTQSILKDLNENTIRDHNNSTKKVLRFFI